MFEGKKSGGYGASDSMESIVGEKAVVKTAISPSGTAGKVEFNGTLWQAEADSPISAGTTVVIVERKNLILKVKPLEGK